MSHGDFIDHEAPQSIFAYDHKDPKVHPSLCWCKMGSADFIEWTKLVIHTLFLTASRVKGKIGQFFYLKNSFLVQPVYADNTVMVFCLEIPLIPVKTLIVK